MINVEEIKKEIDRLGNEIKELQKERKKLVKKLCNYLWYEKTKPPLQDKTNTIAYQTIGKRRKDFTEEELKEYNRVCQQQTRARKKAKGEEK